MPGAPNQDDRSVFKIRGSIRRLDLKPGDTVVLECSIKLSMASCERITDGVGKFFDSKGVHGVGCIILEPGMTLKAILGKAQSEEKS